MKMSNDLISRSASIENIWSLYNNIYNNASVFEKEETQLANRILTDVQRTIENLPTAYDVDNVMGQIESIMDDESIRFCDQAVRRSVNIVKAGGVSDNH